LDEPVEQTQCGSYRPKLRGAFILSNDVWRLRCVALGLTALLLGMRAVEGDVVLPAPGSDGWEHVRFPSVERATEYRVEPEQGALRAVSRCGASALVLPLDGLDLERTPLLRWRWRIVRLPSVGDERERSGDDFAARVYVMFPFDPEGASALTRLRRLVAERVFGRRLPGSALNYVWSVHEPVSSRWDNPYAAESKMISVGRGEPGGWTAVEVDLRRDRQAAWGDGPGPAAIAIMTDADDSCSEAEAWFADLHFASKRDAPATDVLPPP
jgi:hypothetical protein